MNGVTQILSAIEEGNHGAAEQLLPLVYDGLRTLAAQKMAQETPSQTLDLTALVHEVYLRLVDVERAQHWHQFAVHDPVKAKLVELRFFAGLTLAQAAECLNISLSTADRGWSYARAWLYAAMAGGVSAPPKGPGSHSAT